MKSSGLVFEERPYNGEVTPTTYEDMSRYGNDGAITGATPVRLPNGLWVWSFNGVNNTINLGDPEQLNLSVDFTILIWLSANDLLDRAIITARGANQNYHWAQEFAGGGVSWFGGWVGGFLAIGGRSLTVLTSAPQLMGVSYTAAGGNFTRNGVPDGAFLYGGNIDTGAVDTHIGSWNGVAQFWNGYIGQVRIYNYALAAEEIGAIWQEERHLFGV